MSEQENVQNQEPMVLIGDQEYNINEQSDAAKEHYVEAVNLRKQLAELDNQLAAMQRQRVNLQAALGFRETSLRESIESVEEAEAEVVN